MKLNAIRIALLTVCLAWSMQASAQPANSTTVIVPFPAGGVLDVLARVLTQKLNEETKEPFLVDNRPGANGMIGAKAVAKAKGDGRVWLMADGGPLTINPFLYPRDADFSAEKDLRPVRALASMPLVLVVSPKFAAKTAKDFIEQAKRSEVTYGSAGIGSMSHLAMAYFGSTAGATKLVHIPYKGGPQLLQALVAGEIDAGFLVLPNVLPFVKRGQIVALAQSGSKRTTHLPDVPTTSELGFTGIELETRYFAWLPASASDEVAKRVDSLLSTALADPTVGERLRVAGLEPVTNMGEADARKRLTQERDTWQRVIRDKGIKPE